MRRRGISDLRYRENDRWCVTDEGLVALVSECGIEPSTGLFKEKKHFLGAMRKAAKEEPDRFAKYQKYISRLSSLGDGTE